MLMVRLTYAAVSSLLDPLGIVMQATSYLLSLGSSAKAI